MNQAWEEYKKRWSGKLRGRIVLLSEAKPLRPQSNAPFHRYTDAELSDIGKAPDPTVEPQAKTLEELKWPEDPAELNKLVSGLPHSLYNQLIDLMNQSETNRGNFFSKEGAVAVLLEDDRARGGSLAAEAAGIFRAAHPLAPPTFVITAEQ